MYSSLSIHAPLAGFIAVAVEGDEVILVFTLSVWSWVFATVILCSCHILVN